MPIPSVFPIAKRCHLPLPAESRNCRRHGSASGRFVLAALVIGALSQSAPAQSTWSFDHANEELTIAADGSLQVDGDSLNLALAGNGVISVVGEDAQLTVSAGKDVLFERGNSPTEALFTIITKRPTSLTSAELAGTWVYHEFAIEEEADGPTRHGFATDTLDFNVNASGGITVEGENGSGTIDARKHFIVSFGPDTLDFSVNASKDLMVSTTSEEGSHFYRLLVRPEAGGTTSQLAGPWTLGALAVNSEPADAEFRLEVADVTVASNGSFTFPGESIPITLSADGNGGITADDDGDIFYLVWSQSRNLLTRAATIDTEHELLIFVRRPDSLALADLAGTWDLHDLSIENPNLSDTIAEAFYPDGTLQSRFEFIESDEGDRLRDGLSTTYHQGTETPESETTWAADAMAGTSVKNGLARFFGPDGTLIRTENYVNDQLAGSPAVQAWSMDGQLILTENWAGGVITQRIERDFDGPRDPNPTVVTTTNFADGTATTQLVQSYHPGTTNLSSLSNLTFTGGVVTRHETTRYQADGVTKIEETLSVSTPAGVVTEQSTTRYRPDGVGLISTSISTFETDGLPISSIVTNYHLDGTTIQSRDTTTYPIGGTRVLRETFYETGTRFSSSLTIKNAAGIIIERRTDSYLPDGVGLTLSTIETHEPDGTPINNIVTRYHPDGTTIQSRETTTYPDGGRRVLSEAFYDTGVKSSELLTINDLRISERSYHPNGNTRELNGYAYLEGVTVIQTEIFYDNGTRHYEGLTIGGQLDGIVTSRHPNGNLQQRTVYSLGRRNGLDEAFDTGERPTRVALYEMDILRHSTNTSYFPSGQRQSQDTVDYSGGVVNRTSTTWNENGTLRSESRSLDGRDHGIQCSFDEQGRPTSMETYLAGVLNGDYTSWHSDSTQVSQEGSYLDGEQDGLWISYSRSGQVERREEYSRGQLDGETSSFDEDGRQVAAQSWVRGQLRRNESWFYDEHGTLRRHTVRTRSNGNLQDDLAESEIDESWDDEGRMSSYVESAFENKHGESRSYREGVLTKRTQFERGLREGLEEVFFYDHSDPAHPANGNLISAREYVAGKLDGLTLIYNPENGWLLERAHYRSGKLHGLREQFFDKNISSTAGSPSYTGEYIHGLRNGLHTTRSAPGVLYSEETYLEDLLHGPRRFYTQGTLTESGEYTHGMRSGQWVRFEAATGKTRRYHYAADFLDGVWEEITGGFLERRRHYANGLAHGLWEEFFENGARTSTRYEHGEEVGPRQVYYPDGTLSSSTPLRFGLIHGTVLSYHRNGQVGSQEEFVAGLRHGDYKVYFDDGSPVMAGSYTGGIPSGTWTEWWPDPHPRGLIWKRGEIKGGRRCGLWDVWGYDGDEQSVYAGTVDNGPCGTTTPNDFPVTRGLEGTITANGTPLARASIDLRDPISGRSFFARSVANGYYRINFPTDIDGALFTATGFDLAVTHPDYVAKQTTVTVSYSDGFGTRNIDLASLDAPILTIGSPSVEGLYFLEDLDVPVSFDWNVDWKNAGGGPVTWQQGDYDDTFSGTLTPGFDFDLGKEPVSVVARNSAGQESNTVDLPAYRLYSQPDWSRNLGSWIVENRGGNGTAATYRLKTAWPEEPVSLGIDEDTLGTPLWLAWSSLPVIGDELGLFDVQFDLDAKAHTNGTGALTFGGQGEVKAAGKSVRLEADGEGDLLWGNSLEISRASVAIDGIITIDEAASALSLFPALEPLEDLPAVGDVISGLNSLASLKFTLEGGVGGRFPIDTANGELLFSPTELRLQGISTATGRFSFLTLATLDASIKGRLLGTWDLTGEDVSLKDFTYTATARASATLDDFMWSNEHVQVITYPSTAPGPRSEGPQADDPGPAFRLIEPDFLEHGGYARFLPPRAARGQRPGEEGAEIPPPPAQTLLGNCYPFANPVVAEQDGTRVIVYVHFDPARPAGQSTRLYYTINTGAGFSTPAPVHQQARADFTPQLSFLDDGRLVAVWKTSRLGQIASTIEERLSGLEIAWSIYDPGTSTWSTPNLLTDNAHLDHSPRLASSPHGPMVLWQSNPGNALIGNTASPTEVHFARWNEDTFSAAASLPASIQPGGLTSLAYDGTDAIFTWIHDEDDDLGTAEDRELYWSQYDGSTWSAPVRVTGDGVVDRAPRVFCLANDSFELVWIKGTDLVRMADFDTRTHALLRASSPSAPPPQYDITCDSLGRIALLWTENESAQVDLRYALFDPLAGTWSDELFLTNDEGFEKSPAFALGGNGDLFVTFLREGAETTRHDLLWLEQSLSQDLTVGPVTVEPSGTPDQFTITAEFRNLGNLAASNVTVDYHLGDPDAGGTMLGSETISLAGGFSCEQSFTTSTLPAGADGTIHVRIDPANTIAESDETNNSATTVLNPVDLVAEDLLGELSPDGSVLTLTGTVHNRGRTLLKDVPVRIDGEQGPLLTASITSLPPGARVEVPVILATSLAFPTDDNLFALKVDPDETLDEPNRSDNEYTLPLTLREPSSFIAPDSDRDGLDDTWELAQFGTLDRDGSGDFDRDGRSDLLEALTGTDPRDPNSRFVAAIDPDPENPGDFLITFPTKLGSIFRIQRTPDLLDWSDYSIHVGTGETLVVPVPALGAPATSLFRLEVEAN